MDIMKLTGTPCASMNSTTSHLHPVTAQFSDVIPTISHIIIQFLCKYSSAPFLSSANQEAVAARSNLITSMWP